MHVWFITPWFPNRIETNHGNFIARHARLLAHDHELTVLTIQPDPNLGLRQTEVTTRTEDGYRLVQVYFGQGHATPTALRPLLRLRAYRRAVRFADYTGRRPDLLHAHILVDGGIFAHGLARLWGLPFLVSEHSSHYFSADPLSGLRGRLARRAAGAARVLTAVSPRLLEALRTNARLEAAFTVVPNVVDEDTFSYLPPPPRPPFRLLHVSSFVEEHKNVAGLLRGYRLAGERLGSNISLRIAGDGDHQRVKRLITASGAENVTLTGPHSEAEIAKLMAEHHAFVLFSHTETQGVVLLEAQCCGRPTIATRGPQLADVVEDGVTGLTVPAGDEQALADAILRLVETYDRFDGAAIREQAVARYGAETVRRRFNDLYAMATGDRED